MRADLTVHESPGNPEFDDAEDGLVLGQPATRRNRMRLPPFPSYYPHWRSAAAR